MDARDSIIMRLHYISNTHAMHTTHIMHKQDNYMAETH